MYHTEIMDQGWNVAMSTVFTSYDLDVSSTILKSKYFVEL